MPGSNVLTHALAISTLIFLALIVLGLGRPAGATGHASPVAQGEMARGG